MTYYICWGSHVSTVSSLLHLFCPGWQKVKSFLSRGRQALCLSVPSEDVSDCHCCNSWKTPSCTPTPHLFTSLKEKKKKQAWIMALLQTICSFSPWYCDCSWQQCVCSWWLMPRLLCFVLDPVGIVVFWALIPNLSKMKKRTTLHFIMPHIGVVTYYKLQVFLIFFSRH